jgi:hypothetical protein
MSAIEPVVSWLAPKMGRQKALFFSILAMLIVMLPASLSYRGVLLGWWSTPFMLWSYDALCTRFLIPLGGALAILFVHKAWGLSIMMRSLERTDFQSGFWASIGRSYFHLCFKWITPILIILIFVHALMGAG